MAENMPVHYETFIKKKYIHHMELTSLNYDHETDKEYIASFKDGKRLVNANRWENRLRNAWKEGGEQGYRDYLYKVHNKKKYRKFNWFERFIIWL